MYLGIDVGGTKTLVAMMTDDGIIKHQHKFPTPQNYDEFLEELAQTVDSFTTKDWRAAGVGIPAVTINRREGIGVNFGNLPWQNVPIQRDVEKLVHCPVIIENDAKMAGLSEAMLLRDTYRTVMYITVSTGIGISVVVDGVIDTTIGDGGGRALLLPHKGKHVPWESFASGKAIFERYGKKASDITDKAVWQRIAHDLASGFIELIALVEPEVIVLGGSIGAHLPKYKQFLIAELKLYELPLIPLPAIIEAQRPVEAVIFGCYDLAKQVYGHAAPTR